MRAKVDQSDREHFAKLVDYCSQFAYVRNLMKYCLKVVRKGTPAWATAGPLEADREPDSRQKFDAKHTELH